MAFKRNERLYGTRLGFTVDGADYWADLSKYEVSSEDNDKAVDFGDAAAGATENNTIKGEAIISFSTGSFWNFVWANKGKTIPMILAPMGNKTAAPGKPHFKVMVNIPRKPGINSEAGDKEGAKFQFEWPCVGDLQMVTTGSTLGTGNADDVLAS